MTRKLILALCLFALTGCDPQSSNSPASPPVAGTAGPELQALRLDLIEGLAKDRVIQKIDTPGTVPRVYVLPAFNALTHDDKQSVVNVCFAWAHELPKTGAEHYDGNMWVYDAMTNKKIGSFSMSWGLALD